VSRSVGGCDFVKVSVLGCLCHVQHMHTCVRRDDVSALEHFPELTYVNLGRMGNLFQAQSGGYCIRYKIKNTLSHKFFRVSSVVCSN
jgi:hypothetical protein